MPLKITSASQAAKKLGLSEGGVIVKINGEPAVDTIDWLALTSGGATVITLRDKGEQRDIKVKRPGALGLEFERGGWGRTRGCCNNCVFCFVDQLPHGMRETMYFKDDDWRMSFVMGNYVTLTNVGESGFERILKRKPAPLFISVHATDDEVRARLLGQERGRGIMSRLKRLAQAGVAFHCQAVLCPGLNDGAILEKSIADLAGLYPWAKSLALVPVGLTGHREGLADVRPYDKDSAEKTLAICEKWQSKCLKELKARFVFAADELYVKAQAPLPAAEEYEDYAQKEDGVGMLRALVDEADEALEDAAASKLKEASIACGTAAAPYLRGIADKCQAALNMRINVYAIKNDFFGHSVTVSGLMTGRDIKAQLAGKQLGEALFISDCALREREDVFLDDMTKAELSEALGVKVTAVPSDGYELIDALSGLYE